MSQKEYANNPMNDLTAILNAYPSGLRMTSCLAPNLDYLCRMVTAYLAQRLGVAIEFVDDLPWATRFQQLDQGEIHLAWICGAPYTERMARWPGRLELLAAPVWRAPHYHAQPVYYSAVVTPAASPFRSMADLRGGRWAYNEATSLSGYYVVCHHLAQQGCQMGYFRSAVATGSHQRALELVAAGAVDGAAIDTTMLEQALLDDPALAAKLRMIARLGPNPMPPWVVHTGVSAALRAALRQALLDFTPDHSLCNQMAIPPLSHFAQVTDQDYLPILSMIQQAATVQLA
ncbi:MAG: PhnD/SsuA/transferrin family substrate-binding protein [Caldilineaceae bacterium]